MYISGIKHELFRNPYIVTGKDYSTSKNYYNVYIKRGMKALRVYAVFKCFWTINVMANSRQKSYLFLQDWADIRVLTGSNDQNQQWKCVFWAVQLTHHLFCRVTSYRLYYLRKMSSYVFSNSPVHFCINRFVPHSFFHPLFHIY